MTDAVIDRLAADLTPVQPRRMWGDALILLAVLIGEFALLAGARLLRSDMMAMSGAMAWWKIAAPLAVAGGASVLALRAGDPSRGRVGLPWLAAAGFAALLLGFGLVGPATLAADAALGATCAAFGTVLAVPPALALGLLLRRAAPLHPRRVAVAAGIAGGAWGGALLGLHCADDTPGHILIWHSLAVVFPAIAAALPLARALRW